MFFCICVYVCWRVYYRKNYVTFFTSDVMILKKKKKIIVWQIWQIDCSTSIHIIISKLNLFKLWQINSPKGSVIYVGIGEVMSNVRTYGPIVVASVIFFFRIFLKKYKLHTLIKRKFYILTTIKNKIKKRKCIKLYNIKLVEFNYGYC